LVADGRLTDVLLDSVYSGVVSFKGFRLVVFLAELNNLELWAADIGNTYLEAYTSGKVYIIAGPEFGSFEGHVMIISKALYGLRSSGARRHDRLADCIRELDFFAVNKNQTCGCANMINCMSMLLCILMIFLLP
jgi:hypothetical protein